MNSNPHQNFRQRLYSGERLIGTFVKTPSMMVAEVLASTQLDCVCVDAEHSPFDRRDIDSNVAAYRAGNMPSLIRVPSAAPEQILNALDCGATGVVIPHVDSAEKAEACVRYLRYGDGGRGYAGSTRAAGYGSHSIETNLMINREQNVLVAQIEDLSAVTEIESIAQVDGIDCFFIGTMDLTVALGAGGPKDENVIAAIKTICNAARSADRRVGIFVPDLDDVPFWAERGVSLFLLSSDHAFLKQGAAALVNKISA